MLPNKKVVGKLQEKLNEADSMKQVREEFMQRIGLAPGVSNNELGKETWKVLVVSMAEAPTPLMTMRKPQSIKMQMQRISE